jgi:hypothetical protein
VRSNIKTSLRETYFEGVESNKPAEIRFQWLVLVNLLIKCPVSKKWPCNFLSSRLIIHFSKTRVLYT